MRTLFSTFAFLLYACLWMIAAPRASAQAPDQSTGVHMIGGDALMEWMGYGGRTYFIQVSGDLKGWTWAPLIEHGADDFISYEFGGTEPRGFARLQYTDAEPPDGVSLEDWDADGDGLSNWAEISIHQTHPLNGDTDGDAMPDGWEVLHGLDPNDPTGDNGANGDPDGDGVINVNEQVGNTSPQNEDDFPIQIITVSRSASGTFNSAGHQVSWSKEWGDDPGGGQATGSDELTPGKLVDRASSIAFPDDPPENESGVNSENLNLESVSTSGYFYISGTTPSGGSGSLSERRAWLRAPKVDYERVFQFLRISENTARPDGISVGQSIVKSVEVIVLTIPPEEEYSDSIDLGPRPIGEAGKRNTFTVSLIPVAVERDLDVANNSWEPAVGKLVKALPGEKINLRIDVSRLPEDFTVGGFEWVLPDKVFKDYVTKYELGKLVELEAEDLNQQSVEFYFTTSGPKDIRVKLNVNGKNVEVETKMEIIKPASTFTAEKGVVRMGMGVGGIHSLGFLGVDTPRFGARYISSVTTPEGWEDGRFAFAQLIRNRRNFTNPPNGNATYRGDGVTWKHDGTFPYGSGGIVIAEFPANGQVVDDIGDSPSEGAISLVRQTIEVRDFFQTYLMFRPDGLESRYVPLRKINWNWGGKASETNNWTVVADPISEVDAASVEIDQHPEWDDNAENNEEQNVN